MLADTPVRSGWAEAGAAVTRQHGPQAWLEAGIRPWERVGLFARAFADPRDAGAMVGVRGEWDF